MHQVALQFSLGFCSSFQLVRLGRLIFYAIPSFRWLYCLFFPGNHDIRLRQTRGFQLHSLIDLIN